MADHALATIDNPSSALTDFTLVVDLSNMPASWWTACTSSDGTRGRVYKGDGTTRLACDWIDFNDTAETGILRVLWSGSLASSGTQQLWIEPPVSGNSAVGVSDTYGQYNAYDASWTGYWPNGGGTNRIDGTASTANGGVTVGGATGKLGKGTDFDGSDDYISSGVNPGEGDFTMSAWCDADISSSITSAIIGAQDASGRWAFKAEQYNNTGHVGFTISGDADYESTISTPSGMSFYSARVDIGSTVYYRVNTSTDSDSIGTPSSASALILGAARENVDKLNGILCEVQYHDALRSADWVSHEYSQTNSNSDFYTTWSWETSGVELAGTIAASSTVAGVLKLDLELEGLVEADSTAAGTLSPAVAQHLAGSIPASSGITGAIEASRSLAGVIAASSEAYGILAEGSSVFLSGTIPAASDVDGAILVAKALAGIIEADGAITGALSEAEAIHLAGVIAGSSGVSGAIQAYRALAGLLAGSSTISGRLAEGKYLAGEANALSTLAGILSGGVRFSGEGVGSSSVTGAIATGDSDLGIIEGDFYFDSNTPALGGGVIRYYDGFSWVEMTPAFAGYADAMNTAKLDLVKWAADNGQQTLAAAVAIIQSLWAYDLMVGRSLRAGGRYSATGTIEEETETGIFLDSNGNIKIGASNGEFSVSASTGEASFVNIPIRSYAGQGVQRRATQLDNDSLDFYDSPVGGDELLRGRIGRLGVGGAILMDGDFNALVNMQWSAESVVNAASSNTPTYIQLNNGEIRVAYLRASDTYLVERTWNGSAWGSESTIRSAAGSPAYVQLSDGTLRISYTETRYNHLMERTWNGSSWGTESEINAASSYSPAYIQLASGELRIAYMRGSDSYLVERVWSGSAWGAESVINAVYSSHSPNYIQLANGQIRIAYSRGGNYLVERIWNGSTWGAESTISSDSTSAPSYTQILDGELRIAYTRNSDHYICERVWSGSAWGAESVINAVYSSDPSFIQSLEGSIRVAYRRYSDGYLLERTLQRYAQIGAGIIESGSDANGSYVKYGDGTMMQWGSGTSGTATINNYNIGTYGWSYYSASSSITFPEEFIDNTYGIYGSNNGTSCAFGDGGKTTTGINMTNITIASSAISYRWLAIGRWKA